MQWMTNFNMSRHIGAGIAVVACALGAAYPNIAAAGEPCEPHWDTAVGQPGMNGWVMALTAFDDGSGSALYAGGHFTTAGSETVNYIARWDGSSWSTLGGGMSGGSWPYVFALTVFDDGSGPALYAGGQFTIAGGIEASYIAKWDGSSWSPLGNGMNDWVGVLTVFDDGSGPALYAGGGFTTAGGAEANRVAKWDGSSWSPLDAGMSGGQYPWVYALTDFDDGSGPALYAGGGFTTAGDKTVNRIAKWDGFSWSPLGNGMSGAGYPWVRALTVFDDDSGMGPALYASGGFTTAGSAAASKVAKWDGSSWSPLGSGSNHNVIALAVFDDETGTGPALYAGGVFSTAGGVQAKHIAEWDGSSWSALGHGMNWSVFALTAFDDGSGSGPALYVGGDFETVGCLTTNRIARWGCTEAGPKVGDLDLNSCVDVADLLILLTAWGECADCNDCPADLTDSCNVGVADLLVLLANWGSP